MRERLQKIRAKAWDLIGGPLEKTPLNPRKAGSIERKNYGIDKVIFESQPQVYVTAHLYVPVVGQPPFPGILAPLGHTSNGKSYRNYQYVYQTLARKGYMVWRSIRSAKEKGSSIWTRAPGGHATASRVSTRKPAVPRSCWARPSLSTVCGMGFGRSTLF